MTKGSRNDSVNIACVRLLKETFYRAARLACILSGLSVYEMKNSFCLIERPLEIQKNGIFLFEISFFVSEILTFLKYAN